MTKRLRRSVPGALLLGALLSAAAACSTDAQYRCGDGPADPGLDPPRFESRVGVPILMDIPVLGVLFSRRTVVR